MKKRLLSLAVVLCMLVSLMPMTAFAASAFSDMPNDYSTAALENAVANGLLKGADGKILPNNNLTRAQMAAVIVRAFGATKEASLTSYKDANATAWYYSEMSKAVYMKALNGSDGKLMPNDNITREQVFAVIARAMNLASGTTADLASYTDAATGSAWAIGTTAAMVKNGYVHGANGKLNPTAKITRKEFAVVMDNVIKQYISKAGSYAKVSGGSVMINAAGVTLKDVTITGNLIIGDGVGDGDITLENVIVKGATIVRGAGTHSLVVKGSSSLGTISIAKVDGNVRVAVEGDAKVSVVEINDGKNDVIVEGKVGTVSVASSDTPVVVQNATVAKVELKAENANVTVAKTATVDTVSAEAPKADVKVEGTVKTVSTTVAAAGAKVEVAKGATVETVNAAAAGTAISGEGTVKNANVTANNVKVDTTGTKATVSQGVTGTTSGGKNVQPGTSTTTGGQSSSGSGSSGGGQTGPSVAQIAALKAVNDASSDNNYAAVKTAIENNAATLGLDLTKYNTLVCSVETGDRKSAVCNDLFQNKPTNGYASAGSLKVAFDEIVATRIVFQTSVNTVNAATEKNPLTDVSYVQTLIDNLKTVKNYTKHSGMTITAKITQLQTLVNRYNALSPSLQAEALKTVSSTDYQSSTQTLNALDTALTAQENLALAAVNGATPDNNYAEVKAKIEENASTLALADYHSLINDSTSGDRQAAVCNDLYNSKPEGGYTSFSTLKDAFDEIVATRIVFQNSVKLVNAASADNPLTDIKYVTMLIENLNGVKNYTKHSGMTIADKITQLQALVDRYKALSADKQAAVLKAVSSSKYQSSTQTLNALDNELEKVAKDALKAVNDASSDNNYAAVKTAIENNAATLGLDLTKYNTLVCSVETGDRKSAVCNDLFQNKPTNGYASAGSLKVAFDEIVATRIVFQDSVKLVNAASADNPLTDIKYVTMLIENLNGVKNYTKHSGMTIIDKITQLQGLVDRYNALSADKDKQAAVLKAVSSSKYQSSTQTLTALDTALKAAEA